MPRLRSMTPGALLRWRARRPASVQRALDVARGNQRYDLPFRAVVRQVEIPIHPTARGGEVLVERLELECGHLVPLPGGALAGRTKPGQVRQCSACAEAAE